MTKYVGIAPHNDDAAVSLIVDHLNRVAQSGDPKVVVRLQGSMARPQTIDGVLVHAGSMHSTQELRSADVIIVAPGDDVAEERASQFEAEVVVAEKPKPVAKKATPKKSAAKK